MHLNAQKMLKSCIREPLNLLESVDDGTDTKKIQEEEGEKNHNNNNKKDQDNHLPPVT